MILPEPETEVWVRTELFWSIVWSKRHRRLRIQCRNHTIRHCSLTHSHTPTQTTSCDDSALDDIKWKKLHDYWWQLTYVAVYTATYVSCHQLLSWCFFHIIPTAINSAIYLRQLHSGSDDIGHYDVIWLCARRHQTNKTLTGDSWQVHVCHNVL